MNQHLNPEPSAHVALWATRNLDRLMAVASLRSSLGLPLTGHHKGLMAGFARHLSWHHCAHLWAIACRPAEKADFESAYHSIWRT